MRRNMRATIDKEIRVERETRWQKGKRREERRIKRFRGDGGGIFIIADKRTQKI